MSYVIVSNRVGSPGDAYTPAPGVNLQTLLDNGFIKESDKKPSKSAKMAKEPKE